MSTTSEAAMKHLLEAKEKARREPGWNSGYFHGLASAYFRACAITYEQYMQITKKQAADA